MDKFFELALDYALETELECEDQSEQMVSSILSNRYWNMFKGDTHA